MSEFEKLRKYWPERQIFQGSARAYIRYCERRPIEWESFEKPLWSKLFQQKQLEDAYILDVGSGAGKLIDVLIENNAKPHKIFSLEPNPILLSHLIERCLGVLCIKDIAYNLDSPVAQNLELDLITANMMVNQLATPDFNKLIRDAVGILKPDGVFAYTVPNPYRKARKHRLKNDDNERVIVEDAPWGGLIEYHHRSMGYQKQLLIDAGFRSSFRFGGYDDTFHTLEGPKRMLVIAQKK